jgi:hypothetical protein
MPITNYATVAPINVDAIGAFNQGATDTMERKQKAYDIFKNRKAEEILGSSLRPDGTVDFGKMMVEGQKAGIGYSTLKQVIATQADIMANEYNLANQKMMLESMGVDRSSYDPNAPVAPVAPVQAEAVQAQVESVPNPVVNPTTPMVPAQGTSQAPVDGSVNGTIQVTGQAQNAPTGNIKDYENDPFANANGANGEVKPPDARQYWNEMFHNKAKPFSVPTEGQLGPDGKVLNPTVSAEDADMALSYASKYAINPANPDKTIKTPTEILTERVNQLVGNVPQVPRPMLPPDPTKRTEVINAYNKAVAERSAKIAEAENLVRKEFADHITTKFGQSMQSQGLEVSKENLALAKKESERKQLEFDRDRQTAINMSKDIPGGRPAITDAPVNQTSLKMLQDTFIPAIADIQMADKGFGGAMQAALAKAKVDGSVNADVILGNLVAMGSMPSDRASEIRMRMTPEAYTQIKAMVKAQGADAAKGLTGIFGIKIGEGTGATNPQWMTSASNNVYQQAQSHGMTQKYYDWAIKNAGGDVKVKPSLPKTTTPVPPTTKSEKKPVKALTGAKVDSRASKKGR